MIVNAIQKVSDLSENYSAILKKHLILEDEGSIYAVGIDEVGFPASSKPLIEDVDSASIGVCLDDPSKAVIIYSRSDDGCTVHAALIEETDGKVTVASTDSIELPIPEEMRDDVEADIGPVSCGSGTAVSAVKALVPIETSSGVEDEVPVFSAFVAFRFGDRGISYHSMKQYNPTAYLLSSNGIGCLNGVCFFAARKTKPSEGKRRSTSIGTFALAVEPADTADGKNHLEIHEIRIDKNKKSAKMFVNLGAVSLIDELGTADIYTAKALLSAVRGPEDLYSIRIDIGFFGYAVAAWKPDAGTIIAVCKESPSFFWALEDGTMFKIYEIGEMPCVYDIYFTNYRWLLLKRLAHSSLARLFIPNLVKKA